jgi:hypothetical protein
MLARVHTPFSWTNLRFLEERLECERALCLKHGQTLAVSYRTPRLQGCAHTLFTSQREREREREGGRERERGRERENERESEKEKEREREYLFLKGMTGALAPFWLSSSLRIHYKK